MGATGITSAAGAGADGDRRRLSDGAGVVVLGACAVWALVSGSVHGGRPEGALLAVLAVAAGYAAGRICGALLPVAAPCAAALAGLGLALAAPYLAPGPQPGVPLGHAGATTALFVLCAGAACCAAWATPVPLLRLALRLLGVGITLTALLIADSPAGAALCVTVLLCSLAAGAMQSRGLGITGLLLAAALTAGTIWAVAESALPDGLAMTLEGRLTPQRVELWRDAVRMAGEEPLLGVGPGRFGELSATAAAVPYPDGKPHSAPLQQLAEQGVVGVVLLAAVYGWVLHALWRSARSTPVVLTAGAALTAVAGVAAVGNALSFSTVTVGAGLLSGLATARPLTEHPSGGDDRLPAERPYPDTHRPLKEPPRGDW
ncbi:O-antigen ligase family protein [Streptomyces sp. enrichment culture]|uniref:O-antigen ligase family protein n=1 Tax=Streptomyces sp. enrichment culture TaxID=1795815 RepID=UPI003F54F333